MKRSTISRIAIAAAISTLSMSNDSYRALLGAEDYRVELENSSSPSVVSPDPGEGAPWKSFNQWVCFSAEDAKVECEPDGTSSTTCYPRLTVQVASGGMSFELLMGDDSLNSGAILNRWDFLLTGAESVCVLAALLPDVSGPQEAIFSLQRIKTDNGYWDYDREDNWREADAEVEN